MLARPGEQGALVVKSGSLTHFATMVGVMVQRTPQHRGQLPIPTRGWKWVVPQPTEASTYRPKPSHEVDIVLDLGALASWAEKERLQ